jgi:hypothetical protein
MRVTGSVWVLCAATVAAVATVGCGAGEYAYQPAVPSRARIEAVNTPRTRADVIYAARYRVPESAPMGGIRVASFGRGVVQAPAGCASAPQADSIQAFHLRFIVRNGTDERPWELDTREILLSVPGQGDLRPLFVNTDAGTLPVVAVRSGERRTVDLYFPLPATRDRLEVAWRVTTGAGVVARRTPFHREAMYNQHPVLIGEIDGPHPFWDSYPGSFPPGQGGAWWLDPSRGPACAPAAGAATPGFWPQVTLANSPR